MHCLERSSESPQSVTPFFTYGLCLFFCPGEIFIARLYVQQACLPDDDSCAYPKAPLYSQRLTVLMMVFPWMFTESFVSL